MSDAVGGVPAAVLGMLMLVVGVLMSGFTVNCSLKGSRIGVRLQQRYSGRPGTERASRAYSENGRFLLFPFILLLVHLPRQALPQKIADLPVTSLKRLVRNTPHSAQ